MYNQIESGRHCHFPFEYKGELHYNCIYDDEHINEGPWCSSTPEFSDYSFGHCSCAHSGKYDRFDGNESKLTYFYYWHFHHNIPLKCTIIAGLLDSEAMGIQLDTYLNSTRENQKTIGDDVSNDKGYINSLIYQNMILIYS